MFSSTFGHRRTSLLSHYMRGILLIRYCVLRLRRGCPQLRCVLATFASTAQCDRHIPYRITDVRFDKEPETALIPIAAMYWHRGYYSVDQLVQSPTTTLSCYRFYPVRSYSLADYWIHFKARFGGVRAFGSNRQKWTDLDEIWITLSTL